MADKKTCSESNALAAALLTMDEEVAQRYVEQIAGMNALEKAGDTAVLNIARAQLNGMINATILKDGAGSVAKKRLVEQMAKSNIGTKKYITDMLNTLDKFKTAVANGDGMQTLYNVLDVSSLDGEAQLSSAINSWYKHFSNHNALAETYDVLRESINNIEKEAKGDFLKEAERKLRDKTYDNLVNNGLVDEINVVDFVDEQEKIISDLMGELNNYIKKKEIKIGYVDGTIENITKQIERHREIVDKFKKSQLYEDGLKFKKEVAKENAEKLKQYQKAVENQEKENLKKIQDKIKEQQELQKIADKEAREEEKRLIKEDLEERTNISKTVRENALRNLGNVEDLGRGKTPTLAVIDIMTDATLSIEKKVKKLATHIVRLKKYNEKMYYQLMDWLKEKGYEIFDFSGEKWDWDAYDMYDAFKSGPDKLYNFSDIVSSISEREGVVTMVSPLIMKDGEPVVRGKFSIDQSPVNIEPRKETTKKITKKEYDANSFKEDWGKYLVDAINRNLKLTNLQKKEGEKLTIEDFFRREDTDYRKIENTLEEIEKEAFENAQKKGWKKMADAGLGSAEGIKDRKKYDESVKRANKEVEGVQDGIKKFEEWVKKVREEAEQKQIETIEMPTTVGVVEELNGKRVEGIWDLPDPKEINVEPEKIEIDDVDFGKVEYPELVTHSTDQANKYTSEMANTEQSDLLTNYKSDPRTRVEKIKHLIKTKGELVRPDATYIAMREVLGDEQAYNNYVVARVLLSEGNEVVSDVIKSIGLAPMFGNKLKHEDIAKIKTMEDLVSVAFSYTKDLKDDPKLLKTFLIQKDYVLGDIDSVEKLGVINALYNIGYYGDNYATYMKYDIFASRINSMGYELPKGMTTKTAYRKIAQAIMDNVNFIVKEKSAGIDSISSIATTYTTVGFKEWKPLKLEGKDGQKVVISGDDLRRLMPAFLPANAPFSNFKDVITIAGYDDYLTKLEHTIKEPKETAISEYDEIARRIKGQSGVEEITEESIFDQDKLEALKQMYEKMISDPKADDRSAIFLKAITKQTIDTKKTLLLSSSFDNAADAAENQVKADLYNGLADQNSIPVTTGIKGYKPSDIVTEDLAKNTEFVLIEGGYIDDDMWSFINKVNEIRASNKLAPVTTVKNKMYNKGRFYVKNGELRFSIITSADYNDFVETMLNIGVDYSDLKNPDVPNLLKMYADYVDAAYGGKSPNAQLKKIENLLGLPGKTDSKGRLIIDKEGDIEVDVVALDQYVKDVTSQTGKFKAEVVDLGEKWNNVKNLNEDSIFMIANRFADEVGLPGVKDIKGINMDNAKELLFAAMYNTDVVKSIQAKYSFLKTCGITGVAREIDKIAVINYLFNKQLRLSGYNMGVLQSDDFIRKIVNEEDVSDDVRANLFMKANAGNPDFLALAGDTPEEKMANLINNVKETIGFDKLKNELSFPTTARYQEVYHGTKSEFSEFDYSHMGEGEGAQAHGRGGYYAVNPDVSREYAVKYGGGVSYKGRALEDFDDVDTPEDEVIRIILNELDRVDIDENTWRDSFEELKEWASTSDYIYGNYLTDDKFYKFVDNLKFEDFDTGRYLYAVEIPDIKRAKTPTGRNYLEEDGIIDYEELQDFMEALVEYDKKKKIGEGGDVETLMSDFFREETGGGLYDYLTDYFGSDKEASMFLDSIGYDGIHYYGGNDGECYVIFDDTKAKISKNVKFQKKDFQKLFDTMEAKQGLDVENVINKKTVRQLAKQYGIGINIVDKILTPEGRRAWGMYSNGLITLSENLIKSTAPHELLHACFDMVDAGGKSDILDGIKKLGGDVSDLDAEERLADWFAEYFNTGKIPFDTKVPKTFREKVMVFFKKIKEFITGISDNKEKIQQLFDDIIGGNIEVAGIGGEGAVRYSTSFGNIKRGVQYMPHEGEQAVYRMLVDPTNGKTDGVLGSLEKMGLYLGMQNRIKNAAAKEMDFVLTAIEEYKKAIQDLVENGGKYDRAIELKQELQFVLSTINNKVILPSYIGLVPEDTLKEIAQLGINGIPLNVSDKTQGIEQFMKGIEDIENQYKNLSEVVKKSKKEVSAIDTAERAEKAETEGIINVVSNDGYITKLKIDDAIMTYIGGIRNGGLKFEGDIENLLNITEGDLKHLSNKQKYEVFKKLSLINKYSDYYSLYKQVYYKMHTLLASSDFFTMYKLGDDGYPLIFRQLKANKITDANIGDRDIEIMAQNIYDSIMASSFTEGKTIGRAERVKMGDTFTSPTLDIVSKAVSEQVDLIEGLTDVQKNRIQRYMESIFNPYTELQSIPSGCEAMVKKMLGSSLDNFATAMGFTKEQALSEFGDLIIKQEGVQPITVKEMFNMTDSQELLPNYIRYGNNQMVNISKAHGPEEIKDVNKEINKVNDIMLATVNDFNTVTDLDRATAKDSWRGVGGLFRRNTLLNQIARAEDRLFTEGNEISALLKDVVFDKKILGMKKRWIAEMFPRIMGGQLRKSYLADEWTGIRTAYNRYYNMSLGELENMDLNDIGDNIEGIGLRLALYFKKLGDMLGSADGLRGVTTDIDINKALYHIGDCINFVDSAAGVLSIASGMNNFQILKFVKVIKDGPGYNDFLRKISQASSGRSVKKDGEEMADETTRALLGTGLEPGDINRFNELFNGDYTITEAQRMIFALGGFQRDNRWNRYIGRFLQWGSKSSLITRIVSSYPFGILPVPLQQIGYSVKRYGMTKGLGVSGADLSAFHTLRKRDNVLVGGYFEFTDALDPKIREELDSELIAKFGSIENFLGSVQEQYSRLGDSAIVDNIRKYGGFLKGDDSATFFKKLKAVFENPEARKLLDNTKENANNIIDGLNSSAMKDIVFAQAVMRNRVYKFYSPEDYYLFMKDPSISEAFKKKVKDEIIIQANRSFIDTMGLGGGATRAVVARNGFGDAMLQIHNFINFRGQWGTTIARNFVARMKQIFGVGGYIMKNIGKPGLAEEVSEWLIRTPEMQNFISDLYSAAYWGVHAQREATRNYDEDGESLSFFDQYNTLSGIAMFIQGLSSGGRGRIISSGFEGFMRALGRDLSIGDSLGVAGVEMLGSFFQNFGRQFKFEKFISDGLMVAVEHAGDDEFSLFDYVSEQFWNLSKGSLRYMTNEQGYNNYTDLRDNTGPRRYVAGTNTNKNNIYLSHRDAYDKWLAFSEGITRVGTKDGNGIDTWNVVSDILGQGTLWKVGENMINTAKAVYYQGKGDVDSLAALSKMSKDVSDITEFSTAVENTIQGQQIRDMGYYIPQDAQGVEDLSKKFIRHNAPGGGSAFARYQDYIMGKELKNVWDDEQFFLDTIGKEGITRMVDKVDDVYHDKKSTSFDKRKAMIMAAAEEVEKHQDDPLYPELEAYLYKGIMSFQYDWYEEQAYQQYKAERNAGIKKKKDYIAEDKTDWLKYEGNKYRLLQEFVLGHNQERAQVDTQTYKSSAFKEMARLNKDVFNQYVEREAGEDETGEAVLEPKIKSKYRTNYDDTLKAIKLFENGDAQGGTQQMSLLTKRVDYYDDTGAVGAIIMNDQMKFIDEQSNITTADKALAKFQLLNNNYSIARKVIEKRDIFGDDSYIVNLVSQMRYDVDNSLTEAIQEVAQSYETGNEDKSGGGSGSKLSKLKASKIALDNLSGSERGSRGNGGTRYKPSFDYGIERIHGSEFLRGVNSKKNKSTNINSIKTSISPYKEIPLVTQPKDLGKPKKIKGEKKKVKNTKKK